VYRLAVSWLCLTKIWVFGPAIGIGDISFRVLAKCILQVAGPAATEACGADQLCACLPAGIEGAVHLIIKHAWDVHHAPEEWGFLLMIDAHNAFKELDGATMLWAAGHVVPSFVSIPIAIGAHL